MSHTWREELHAAGKRKRIPPPPAGVRMTSAELRLCEDLTERAQRADGQRKQEMEKQLLFFSFPPYLHPFCHVSEKQELENKNGGNAALGRASSGENDRTLLFPAGGAIRPPPLTSFPWRNLGCYAWMKFAFAWRPSTRPLV